MTTLQQLNPTTEVQPVGPKSVSGFRLTEREVAVLQFTLEMKFASVESIYRAFYWKENSLSHRYAYERINLLAKHDYLARVPVYTERCSYYLVTEKGRDLIQTRYPDRTIVSPATSIDVRYFEHDRRVLWCRIARESAGNACNWVSERRLKHDWARASESLSRQFLPDGLYTNKRGEKVAFELELAPKTRDRYSAKIDRFLEIVANPTGLFRRVLFVTCNPWVEQSIKERIRDLGSAFLVLPYDEVVGGIYV